MLKIIHIGTRFEEKKNITNKYCSKTQEWVLLVFDQKDGINP